jgi:hypothetical protein
VLGTGRQIVASSEYESHRGADPTSGSRHGLRHGPGSRGHDEAMQRRARALAEQAIERNQIWARRLGIAPTKPRAKNDGSEPSRQLSLTAIAGTSTMNTYPSARKTQRGVSKRSTSAVSAALPSTGRRDFPTRPERSALNWELSLSKSSPPQDQGCETRGGEGAQTVRRCGGITGRRQSVGSER